MFAFPGSYRSHFMVPINSRIHEISCGSDKTDEAWHFMTCLKNRNCDESSTIG